MLSKDELRVEIDGVINEVYNIIQINNDYATKGYIADKASKAKNKDMRSVVALGIITMVMEEELHEK